MQENNGNRTGGDGDLILNVANSNDGNGGNGGNGNGGNGLLLVGGANFHWPRVSEFLCDEHGSATIEFVLWVPVYVIILVAVTDASVLYLTHTEMWNTARDSARRISVGAMTAADVPDRAREKLLLAGRTYTDTHHGLT